ncbi:hypothetical protein SPHINGOAX6_70213 [Sphingomonas sp. AX6]|nr:hypothetical protein SPHINGOAX6_70213 [Sphingomonas sp. AX6]
MRVASALIALIWAVAVLLGFYGYGWSGLRASLFDFDRAEIESQIVAWILFLGSPLLAAYLWQAAPKQT